MRTHPQPLPDLYPEFRPTLDLNFALTRTLDPRITFTRATPKRVIGPDGTLQTVGINQPGFAHDPVTGLSLGLLPEESRTNLLLNSDAPVTQNVTVTAAAHTLSFTGTGTVTLSGASTAGPLVGTGAGEANRVRLTFTPAAGTLTLTVSGTVTNAQLEAGAFATSYIATSGAAATRAADIPNLTGANFSSWYRQDQGTFLVEVRPLTVNQLFPAFGVNTSGFIDMRGVWKSNDLNTVAGLSWVGISVLTPARLSVRSSVANVYSRVAFSYSQAADAVCANGGPVATATVGVGSPAPNKAYIGQREGLFHANCPIARIRYWPRRLPDAQLQRLTAL